MGKEEYCKQISLVCVGSTRSHTGFALAHGVCTFPVDTAQAPGCSAGKLSTAGPGMHALPRSKPLRFRFFGTPQRCRLNWACVLCPSQVRVAQATRCLAHALSSGAVRPSYRLPVPAARFRVCSGSAVSGVPCVSSGEPISGCHPPCGCQPSWIPGRLG